MAGASDITIEGLIFNIQKYSVHDGPGIRTNVFFKGCPLRCLWCCNPESQSHVPELGYNSQKCLGDGRCILSCPTQALSRLDNGSIFINRNLCKPSCNLCINVCPGKALVKYGTRKTVKDVLYVVERESQFYARSGGGVTISGGEPFSQPEFLMALLRESKKRRIHIAMESCGFAPENLVLDACRHLDYLLYDIKCMDDTNHKRITGVSNEIILRNLLSIRSTFAKLPIRVRTPVIPGINDSREAIEAIYEFVRSLSNVSYELLPYHHFGKQKYDFLGREYLITNAKTDMSVFKSLLN